MLLFAGEHVLEHFALKEVELRLVAEEAGFIDGEIFDQLGQLFFALRD